MKKLLLAAGGLVAAASAAVAGGLANAVMEPAVIEVAEDKASTFGWLIPLLIIGILIALATQPQDSSPV